jgi:CheY-like chemotaxis protein
LTRQLLAFSRKQVQSLQVLDLNSVLQDLGRMLPRLIGEDIQLALVPGDHLGRVEADPVQIEQVVMNLATNARDAMPQGGKLLIETSNVELDEAYLGRHPIVPAGSYVLLTVTDSGGGIPGEHLPHIFEPFYTTKEKGKGTGLGLATVYGIVKQNGGYIWVYSEPGLGTTFKIYLPQAGAAARPKAPEARLAESPKGHETLLVVEDEEPVRRSEVEFLEFCGYRVLEATDGRDALRVAREYQGEIHLMVTDVVMPNMSGPDAASQIGNIRQDMKVLFVSGYANPAALRREAQDSPIPLLQKPFTLKLLACKIRQALTSQTPEHPRSVAMA